MNRSHISVRQGAAALLLGLVTVLPTWAAQDASTPGLTAKPTAQTSAGQMTDGEVRRIDKDVGRLTLRHGEIKSLDMPPMTMVFVVKDKAMLDPLKVGDKVLFKAINDGGKFTVTEIQRQP